MFTGLVETTGIFRRRSGRPVARALFEASFVGPLVLGESIAVDGVCLTVDRILDNGFEADMSEETIARTTLGDMTLGARVHLERATPVGGRLGGHIVAGHVDGVGRVVARDPRGGAIALSVHVPADLSPFVAPKGSITIDGVSLTLNAVRGGASPSSASPSPVSSSSASPAASATDAAGPVVEVMLVPHTLASTHLGDLRPGDRVNIEVDVLARYVARWLEFRGTTAAPAADSPAPQDDERLLQKLRTSGFL